MFNSKTYACTILNINEPASVGAPPLDTQLLYSPPSSKTKPSYTIALAFYGITSHNEAAANYHATMIEQLTYNNSTAELLPTLIEQLYINAVAVRAFSKPNHLTSRKQRAVENFSSSALVYHNIMLVEQSYFSSAMYSQTSKQRTLWERAFCPLFGGCPYLGGSIV